MWEWHRIVTFLASKLTTFDLLYCWAVFYVTDIDVKWKLSIFGTEREITNNIRMTPSKLKRVRFTQAVWQRELLGVSSQNYSVYGSWNTKAVTKCGDVWHSIKVSKQLRRITRNMTYEIFWLVLENKKMAISIVENISLPLYWYMGTMFMFLMRQNVSNQSRPLC